MPPRLGDHLSSTDVVVGTACGCRVRVGGWLAGIGQEHARAAHRQPGHLDLHRDEAELWGEPVLPLGVGPVVEVDTTVSPDFSAVTAEILRAADDPS